jgi:hypothetical protein
MLSPAMPAQEQVALHLHVAQEVSYVLFGFDAAVERG